MILLLRTSSKKGRCGSPIGLLYLSSYLKKFGYEFPVCETCYNYEHFKKVIADKRFDSYIQLLRKVQKKIGEHSG